MMREELSLDDLKNMIQGGETLSVEFKGDWEGSRHSPNGLPDRDLVASVVSLANTKGGYLLSELKTMETLLDYDPDIRILSEWQR